MAQVTVTIDGKAYRMACEEGQEAHLTDLAGRFEVLTTLLEIDARRIEWSARDIVENRPALSRWHPDFAEAFAAHMRRDEG